MAGSSVGFFGSRDMRSSLIFTRSPSAATLRPVPTLSCERRSDLTNSLSDDDAMRSGCRGTLVSSRLPRASSIAHRKNNRDQQPGAL